MQCKKTLPLKSWKRTLLLLLNNLFNNLNCYQIVTEELVFYINYNKKRKKKSNKKEKIKEINVKTEKGNNYAYPTVDINSYKILYILHITRCE